MSSVDRGSARGMVRHLSVVRECRDGHRLRGPISVASGFCWDCHRAELLAAGYRVHDATVEELRALGARRARPPVFVPGA